MSEKSDQIISYPMHTVLAGQPPKGAEVTIISCDKVCNHQSNDSDQTGTLEASQSGSSSVL